jgi:hypothetical protein
VIRAESTRRWQADYEWQRTLLIVVLTLATAVNETLAGERFRTAAEVERRRQEIAVRLGTIAEETKAVAQALTDVTERLARANSAERLQLEREALVLFDRWLAIEGDAAALRDEHSRLAAIPTRSATGPLQRGDAQGLGTLDLQGAGDQTTAASAFNPAISIIPDANYYADNRHGRGYTIARQADGFAMAGEDEAAPTDPVRGFNLREVEAVFSGAVDPYFDVWATIVIQRDRVQAEEAYIQTRRFIPGLQLRFGRFLSHIGYINRQHPHQWDFFDQALPYEAILGGGLSDTGVQLTWLPALPVYTLFGFEALQGENSRFANRLVDEFPEVFAEKAGPRLLTGFFRVSPDVGYSNALQIGLSYGDSRGHQKALETDGVLQEALEGRSWLAGADVVWRHESGRAYGRGNGTLQAEYLYRRQDLERVAANGTPIVGGPRRVSVQDGLYVQAVYGFAARWTAAGRYDVIGLRNHVEAPAAVTEFDSSTRMTANVTFNPTEFSRIRTQYSHGRYRQIGEIVPVHQFAIQFQMSLGAHGAHRF